MVKQTERTDIENGQVFEPDVSAAALYHAYIDMTCHAPDFSINNSSVETLLGDLERSGDLYSLKLLARYAIRLPQYQGQEENFNDCIERAKSGVIELRHKYAEERRHRIMARATRVAGVIFPKLKTS